MNKVIIWVIFNLIFTNFLFKYLPANAFSFFISMWMPGISSLIFLKFENIPIKNGINWKIGTAKSYLDSLAVPFLVGLITISIGLITKKLTLNPDYQFHFLSALMTLFIWFLSSLGEEIGWRGYLHNHLREFKHAPLIIGVVWGAWHYRQLLEVQTSLWTLVNFTCLTILVSYFLSWLIESKGSVLACGLFHGFWNFLRLKVLFGNPEHGTKGLFISSIPELTEMEGFFGLIALAIVTTPFIFMWYRNHHKVAKRCQQTCQKSAGTFST